MFDYNHKHIFNLPLNFFKQHFFYLSIIICLYGFKYFLCNTNNLYTIKCLLVTISIYLSESEVLQYFGYVK